MPEWMASKEKRLRKSVPPRPRWKLKPKPPRSRTTTAPTAARAGRDPNPSPSRQSDKAQRNFTDPDSPVMPTKSGFIQVYNAQAAVDGAHQIIEAHTLTNSPSDQAQLAPLLDAIKANLGTNPDEASADAGYCSQVNLAHAHPTPDRGLRRHRTAKARHQGHRAACRMHRPSGSIRTTNISTSQMSHCESALVLNVV